jgi:hypothetical protein
MNTEFPIVELEPKQKHRFIVTFPEDFNLAEWRVREITPPSFSNDWDDMVITFIDPISPSTSDILYKLVERIRNRSINENDLRNFIITLQTLDPIGDVVGTWTIVVDDILNISFGDYGYGFDGLLNPKMSLKIKDCILK